MLLMHLFVYFSRVNFCPFSLPLGVSGCWLLCNNLIITPPPKPRVGFFKISLKYSTSGLVMVSIRR